MPSTVTPEMIDLREQLRAEALRSGFSRVGFTTAEPLSPARQIQWRRWRELDKAGTMRYLMREEPRRTHPRDLMAEARSVMVVLAAYYDGDHPAPPVGEGLVGKVARYAWGRDYHEVFRERLTALAGWLEGRVMGLGLAGPLVCRPCVDSAPLDERALAVRAGLGFIGKNGLLIDPHGGSWTLIGSLMSSLPLPPDEVPRDPQATCADCHRCLEACPTGALEAPWRMDPRRCLSYLTIEQKEEIPAPLAAEMNGWVFGCDLCQEVCPFNARPLERLLDGLAAREGVGPWAGGSLLAEAVSGKGFLRRWGHTPLGRPGRKGLERNLRALAAVADQKTG